MGTGGQSAADIVSGLLLVFSILWVIVIAAPINWHVTNVYLVLKFETCLYQVTVTKQIAAIVASMMIPKSATGIKSIADKLDNGRFSLQEMQDHFCVFSNEYCDDWRKLQMASWMMLFGGIIIVLCLWFAAGYLIYFWHFDCINPARKYSRVFLYLAPSLSLLSVMMYFFLTVGFGDSGQALHYGPGFYIAAALTLFSGVPLLVFEKFINHSAMVHLNQRRLQKGMLEQEFGNLSPYGMGLAANPGSAGWQPQVLLNVPAWPGAAGLGPPTLTPSGPRGDEEQAAAAYSENAAFPQHWGGGYGGVQYGY